MAHKIEGWPCNFSGQVHTEQQSGPEQADEYRLLSTGQYGDFEIECRGHIFKVHKAIMSSASPFFKSAIDGPFKVVLQISNYARLLKNTRNPARIKSTFVKMSLRSSLES